MTMTRESRPGPGMSGVARQLAISPSDPDSLASWAARVPFSGADAVLLRVVRDTETWMNLMIASGVPVLIHWRSPRADALMAKEGVVGFHLPASEAPARFRSRVPGLLGQSVHSLAAAMQAEAGGCDYVTLSPIFAPGSKRGDRRPTLGLDGLATVCRAVVIPVLALGGVGPAHAAACRAAGAWGVAGISGW